MRLIRSTSGYVALYPSTRIFSVQAGRSAVRVATVLAVPAFDVPTLFLPQSNAQEHKNNKKKFHSR